MQQNCPTPNAAPDATTQACLAPLQSHPHEPGEVLVVALLCWRQDRMLVQQRTQDQPLPLLWEFPGGKVEPAEAETDALVRECREEMGVEVTAGSLAFCSQAVTPRKKVRLHFYHGRISEDAVPEPRSSRRLAWLSIDEMQRLVFCPADVALLAALASGRVAPE